MTSEREQSRTGRSGRAARAEGAGRSGGGALAAGAVAAETRSGERDGDAAPAAAAGPADREGRGSASGAGGDREQSGDRSTPGASAGSDGDGGAGEGGAAAAGKRSASQRGSGDSPSAASGSSAGGGAAAGGRKRAGGRAGRAGKHDGGAEAAAGGESGDGRGRRSASGGEAAASGEGQGSAAGAEGRKPAGGQAERAGKRSASEPAKGSGGAGEKRPGAAAGGSGKSGARKEGAPGGKAAASRPARGKRAPHADDAQPFAERVFRAPTGIASGVLLLVLGGWLGIDTLVTGTGRTPWIALCGLLAFGPLVAAYTLRPAVFAGNERMRVRNPLRTITVPWSSVESLQAGYTSEVIADGRKYQLWSIPVSLRARKGVQRHNERVRAGEAPRNGFMGFGKQAVVSDADMTEKRAHSDEAMDQLRELALRHGEDGESPSAPGPVTVRWAYEMVVPSLLGAIGLLVLYLTR